MFTLSYEGSCPFPVLVQRRPSEAGILPALASNVAATCLPQAGFTSPSSLPSGGAASQNQPSPPALIGIEGSGLGTKTKNPERRGRATSIWPQRLIITRVPVLIGDGIPLFGGLPRDVRLRHVATHHYPSGLVKTEYRVAV